MWQNRMVRRLISLIAGVVTLFMLLGCGIEVPNDPGVADVDFSPEAVISLKADGISIEPLGDHDATNIPKGTVLEIHNDDSSNRRIRGLLSKPDGGNDVLYDTGTMLPGDSTTIVLATVGEVTFRDMDTPDVDLTISVNSRE